MNSHVGSLSEVPDPRRYRGQAPEWFQFDSDNLLRFRAKDAGLEGEAVPLNKFVVPRQDATYDNPYGFLDLSMCFWPVTFKRRYEVLGTLCREVRFTVGHRQDIRAGRHRVRLTFAGLHGVDDRRRGGRYS